MIGIKTSGMAAANHMAAAFFILIFINEMTDTNALDAMSLNFDCLTSSLSIPRKDVFLNCSSKFWIIWRMEKIEVM
jgi:hypothetical protein